VTAQHREQAPDENVSVGDLSLDPSARTAAIGGKPLALTAVEYEILLSLARAAGRVKTREQLLLEVADRDFEVFDRSIDVHVSSLRKKLGDDPKSPRYIETVRSAGYRMKK
jgi:DNA-binding response OmpR family regulator